MGSLLRRSAWLLGLFLVCGAAAPRAQAGKAAEPAGAGTLRGKVTAEGGIDTPTVVYIEKAAESAKPGEPQTITQRNTQFEPASLVVTQGTTVNFPNVDHFYHNVFSPSAGNKFDLGLYRGGASKSFEFDEPGEVELYCNIHPSMEARVLVLQNRFYAQVGADGSYTIANVPPGKYALVVWSAKHEPQRKELEVRPGAALKTDFALTVRKEAKVHLNKEGEQYGRYK